MDRQELEQQFLVAFAGVRLGAGVSLRQTQVIDRFGEGVTNREFQALPLGEAADDWTQVPFTELEQGWVAHLDFEGLRYYLPALMLSVLDTYDSSSMRVIGTLMALDPDAAYGTMRFEGLSGSQKSAIASFLVALPQLLELGHHDAKIASRLLRNYWGRYVAPSSTGA
jgi:hypothetical protein